MASAAILRRQQLKAKKEQQLELSIQEIAAAQSPWTRIRDWWLPEQSVLFDRVLVWLAFGLLTFGFVMVSSASFPIAERLTDNPFHFVIRHCMYLVLGLALLAAVVQVPSNWWFKGSGALLLAALASLVVVLVVGHEVNGARRWLKLGPITIQVAEVAKFFFVIYLGSYLTRRIDLVQESLREFIKPLVVLFFFAVLLLMQPDFGSLAVMVSIVVGMLFLAGARLWQFFAILVALALGLTLLIIKEPYRMKRVTSFLDPWDDPFGSGYQLTQSLMAFGRGDWLGQGLGNSIQKLQYLPEAHTDFIMAVVGEELGFIGLVVVLLAVFGIVIRALLIGRRGLHVDQRFGAFVAYGIGIWFAFQALVNIGAAAGMLPTKGLTLPLVSYGGTSLLVSCAALGLLLRIDYEIRVASVKVAPRSGLRRRRANA
ncbi:putative peptidoglycan glycosyltransferase FtsW [Pseudidiomarina piscicola]|uniref:Probable peptidoglycan glycosyltransferase FtsW n=1 Tax=Pseudidiomarina piscicola TaxID=2614830 RepID=A0A6S6WNE0_9GAMM|nr:cell division protein FtsW [Pseudidiomarina piscicola]CAB0150991.1 putative peptidoglycan glycosyltransferase FtsW [Pseudidiomarina piscicola]VZT40502.1 putative peptidoglycan glycosyltransferase FtsW [Pseudomonas aeruginosa]